jgi:twitching motility protein PilT
MDLNALLAAAVARGASDLHLKIDAPAMVRVDGGLVPIDEYVLGDEDLEHALELVTELSPAKRELFHETGDLDISYTATDVGRFRVNGFRQRGAISFAFRYVPSEVPTFEMLGLPTGVEKIAEENRGLVLVTGATGSGKSTTLAAMVDKINRSRNQHVVTIEDPIEIIHPDIRCIVNQREIGLDTESFRQALRRVLRQDPDVILIGELRDEETAQVALQAAESGHLVLSTMHTVDAAETIGRMIEFFPGPKQMMIRQILAGVLRGVVSQRLLPALGGGRIAAIEVMVNTARIADLIREPEKTDGILEAIEEGGFHHMQSFSQHLVRLVLEEKVDFETAAAAATNRHDFELAVQQALRLKQSAAATAAAAAEAEAAEAGEGAEAEAEVETLPPAEPGPEEDGSVTLRLAAP